MAVSALPRTRAGVPHHVASLAPAALLLTLLAPAIDLIARVQPAAVFPMLAIVGCSGAGAVLLLTWLRYPRTAWLAAASLASFASLAMRLAGAEVAPLLSLLAVVALGLGGAFAPVEPATDPLSPARRVASAPSERLELPTPALGRRRSIR